MRIHATLLLATALTFTVAAIAPAQAAPILGSHVDSSVFTSNLGSASGWAYEGQSIGNFDMSGTASLVSRSSGYADSFGFSRTNHSGLTESFSPAATAGSTTMVAGYSPGYLLYFKADGSDFLFFSDDNTQFTDGHSSGSLPGSSQGGLDIFFNAASSTWAFFFDDAGGGIPIAGDDNDYNDMVVTYRTTAGTTDSPTGVPEPASAALLGLGLLAIGWVVRRKPASPHAELMAS